MRTLYVRTFHPKGNVSGLKIKHFGALQKLNPKAHESMNIIGLEIYKGSLKIEGLLSLKGRQSKHRKSKYMNCL
jgi:hypothetical protein